MKNLQINEEEIFALLENDLDFNIDEIEDEESIEENKSVASLIDTLTNAMEHFESEGDFVAEMRDLGFKPSDAKRIWSSYWKLNAKVRFRMGNNDWTRFLNKLGLSESALGEVDDDSPSKRLGAFDTGGGKVDGDLDHLKKDREAHSDDDDEEDDKEEAEEVSGPPDDADDEDDSEDDEEQREGHADRLSALQKFRRSPEYAAMMNGGQEEGLNAVAASQAIIEMCVLGMSNTNVMNVLNGKPLIEDESKHNFVNSIIVACIDAGLNQNLVEVETGKSGKVYIYLDDRINDKLEEIDNLLSQYGEVNLVRRPEDDRVLGTYLYAVSKSGNKSPHSQATGREQIGSIPQKGTRSAASKNSSLHLY